MPPWNQGQSYYLATLKSEYPEFMESLDILTEQQKYVLLERLKGKTLSEVAPSLPRKNGGTGVTRERIRQLEGRACRRLIGKVIERRQKWQKVNSPKS